MQFLSKVSFRRFALLYFGTLFILIIPFLFNTYMDYKYCDRLLRRVPYVHPSVCIYR